MWLLHNKQVFFFKKKKRLRNVTYKVINWLYDLCITIFNNDNDMLIFFDKWEIWNNYEIIKKKKNELKEWYKNN